ncbi:MAG: NDP-hexose 2,3-dehydratase family protein [Spirochaetaceae bacterium]|jgi:oxidase EvaA|nr:NDP-hexose 2,3-dehydratase family protein [Spirochaetaceae bacterium]
MLLRSLCSINDGAKNSFEAVIRLIEQRNREIAVDVKTIPFSRLDGWSMDEDGSLKHSSGKFFSVEGIEVTTDYGAVHRWTQPVINQPEIGYLGLIAKEFNGVLHFLMQMKIEPGNIDCVQASPTLQATKSNFRQVHKGRKPLYLDYFEKAAPNQIIVDQLQSEHGSRFLRKRNRNIIIMADGDIEVHEDFCWMTAGQIKALLLLNDKVNSPARSVFSLLNIGAFILPFDDTRRLSGFGKSLLLSARTNYGLHTMDYLLSWLSGIKARYDLNVRPYPLSKMTEWRINDSEIFHKDDKFFKVLGISVSIASREVTSWRQPVIAPVQNYLCVFIIKEINGIQHFLVQAKLECGNYDAMELAPSVQCLTGKDGNTNGYVPFLDYVRGVKQEHILHDTIQSEEGGRFYHDRNRYMLITAGEDFQAELPENYVWMTLNQIYSFLRFNNFVNAQARSLLAALPYLENQIH